MREWEVWFARFPYEEDTGIVKNRPVIILNMESSEILSVKVTTHAIRDNDDYEIPIFHWQESGLNNPSVARIAKSVYLTKDKFTKKIGDLHMNDINNLYKKYIEFIENQ